MIALSHFELRSFLVDSGCRLKLWGSQRREHTICTLTGCGCGIANGFSGLLLYQPTELYKSWGPVHNKQEKMWDRRSISMQSAVTKTH